MRRVTAIVISYFTGPLLVRSLESLKRQADVSQIILVDNGNWDGAIADVIDESAPGAPIEIITGHGNVGFATACNLGAKKASGDYLVFLNPDASIAEGGIERMLAEGDRLEHPWLIGARLVNPDGSEQQGSRRGTLTPWRAFVEITQLYRLAPNHPYFRKFNRHTEEIPDGIHETPTISGACFFLSREDYFSIGGMDEQYFLHVEDVDFCLRFRNAGGTVYFDPSTEVLHHQGSSRVNAMRVERRKTMSIIQYFRTHFSDAYPPFFMAFVSMLLWTGFGLKAARRALGRSFGLIGIGPHARARRRRMRELQGRRSSR